MKHDDNHALAQKVHKEEAAEIACEWVREACDARFAKKMQARLEIEEKEERDKCVIAGEKEALKAAMEERRAVKAKAEAKKRIEQEDAAMAKKSILDDIDASIKLTEACAKDDEAAKNLHALLQDEVYAEEVAMQESKKYEAMKEAQIAQAKEDESRARSIQRDLDIRAHNEAKVREARDVALAMSEQQKIIMKEQAMMKHQEKADYHLARNMHVKSEREAHRSRKAEAVERSSKTFRTAGEVRKQWMDAAATIEDVARGICITIQLPFMRDLKVRVGSQQNVEIEARRLLASDEPFGESEDDGSCYVAEFLIDGAKTRITDECMSYEYSSVSGLLHVYIDNVHLDKMDTAEKMTMMSKFKNSFGRIFGRSNRKAEAK